MHRILKPAAAAAIAALAAATAIAQDGPTPEALALQMRQAHMINYATNLGRLGGMAQGNVEYDAAAAQVAADNLFHLASMDQGHYWLPGTAAGEVEGSAALPAIWENMADYEARQDALLQATVAMQSAAGTDLASLQAALGGVGRTCGGCHELYRAPSE